MKAIKSIFLSTILLLIQSCGDKSKEDNPRAAIKFETVQADTINKTDTRGLKQGEWRVTDWSATTEKHKRILIESGYYVDNKKQGAWHYYDSTGKLIRTVNYKDDWPVNKQ